MPKVKVFNQNGKELREIELADTVFGVEVNDALLHEVVTAQRANKRQGTKCTLSRTEVRGGGKKPWRQKHTGKARQGSTRSPQWTGGGVVFAPKPRSFNKKVNKKAAVSAIKSALSAKLRDGELIVLDALNLTEPKTREVAQVLESLNLDRSVLLVYENDGLGANSDLYRAGRNIPNLTLLTSNMINVYDLIRSHRVVVLEKAAKAIEEAYAE